MWLWSLASLALPLFTFLRLCFSLKEQTETKNCIPCCSGNSSLVQRGCRVPLSSCLTGRPVPPPPPASVMPAVNSGRCWLPAHQAQEGLWPFQLPFPRLLVLLYYWQVKLVEKSFPEQTKCPREEISCFLPDHQNLYACSDGTKPNVQRHKSMCMCFFSFVLSLSHALLGSTATSPSPSELPSSRSWCQLGKLYLT